MWLFLRSGKRIVKALGLQVQSSWAHGTSSQAGTGTLPHLAGQVPSAALPSHICHSTCWTGTWEEGEAEWRTSCMISISDATNISSSSTTTAAGKTPESSWDIFDQKFTISSDIKSSGKTVAKIWPLGEQILVSFCSWHVWDWCCLSHGRWWALAGADWVVFACTEAVPKSTWAWAKA